MNEVIAREVAESHVAELPVYVSMRDRIAALQTPAKTLLTGLLNDFEEAFGLPNELLPKEYRNGKSGDDMRSVKELERMMRGTVRHRQTPQFVPSTDGKASRLEQYVAEQYRTSITAEEADLVFEADPLREFEFIEDSDRLERAQRNFLKGLIRAGAVDADDLIDE